MDNPHISWEQTQEILWLQKHQELRSLYSIENEANSIYQSSLKETKSENFFGRTWEKLETATNRARLFKIQQQIKLFNNQLQPTPPKNLSARQVTVLQDEVCRINKKIALLAEIVTGDSSSDLKVKTSQYLELKRQHEPLRQFNYLADLSKSLEFAYDEFDKDIEGFFPLVDQLTGQVPFFKDYELLEIEITELRKRLQNKPLKPEITTHVKIIRESILNSENLSPEQKLYLTNRINNVPMFDKAKDTKESVERLTKKCFEFRNKYNLFGFQGFDALTLEIGQEIKRTIRQYFNDKPEEFDIETIFAPTAEEKIQKS